MERPDDPEDPVRKERLRELAEELRGEPAGVEGLRRRLEDMRDRRRREDDRPEGYRGRHCVDESPERLPARAGISSLH